MLTDAKVRRETGTRLQRDNSRPETCSLHPETAATSSFDILEALFHNAVTRLVGGSIMADRVSHALKALDVPG